MKLLYSCAIPGSLYGIVLDSRVVDFCNPMIVNGLSLVIFIGCFYGLVEILKKENIENE